jgi:predicted DNA-binding protein (UPF0251 family)
MARPPKWRCIRSIPDVTHFKPAGIPARLLEEACLSLEEAEAIRLKDLEGWDQEQCAESMKISRTTFHRIIGSARRKVADALLNGKAIRIEGGHYGTAEQRYRCNKDEQEWQVPFESTGQSRPQVCPICNRTDVYPIPPLGSRRGRGHGRGRRRRLQPINADQDTQHVRD